MPTTKARIVHLTRQVGKVLPTLMGKRERISHPYTKEPEVIRNDGIWLNITDRVELLELQKLIEQTLEECKDDGYHC